MRMIPCVLTLSTVVAAFSVTSGTARAATPDRLRVEYMAAPMAVDALPPRLSWVPPIEQRGAKQAAYQIQVAKSAAMGSPVWDSGRVEGAQFVNVPYGGTALESGATYYWRVRTWDTAGHASDWSAPARFGVGLLNKADWKGQWIEGGNALRKEFTLPAPVVRAKIFVAAAGYYELRINGTRIGDHVLDPANSTFAKRILYAAYDVTHVVRQGANAVGLLLGEGWFRGRVALIQLNVELEGGRSMEIHTDTSWQAGQSPILEDSIYNGETYDARKEQPGWDRAGFTGTGWKPASAVAKEPTALLSGQTMPPIKVVQDIAPFKLTNPAPGVYVYDMGQNFSGWVKLRVSGPAGTRVRLRHAELLYDNGMLNVENLRSARATDVYILKGSGEEVYQPHFTYHGFRYVEVTGYPGVPPIWAVTGRVVHSAVPPVGGFASSKPLLNEIQRLVQWGIASNLESMPTDCNQRDERMGWMADGHLYAEAAMYNYDMAAFYTNWLRAMHDEQAEDGSVPDTVPRARFAVGPADPAWGSAYPLITWYMWQHYGDRRLLEQHIEGLKKWSDFLWGRSENGVLNFVKYGDWVPVEFTPGNLVSTAYSYISADIVANVAKVLGRSVDEQAYRQRADAVAKAFNGKFLDAQTGVYGNGTQTSYLLPIALNIVPKESLGRVRGNLNNDLIYKWNSHLSTGILGTKYLFDYLPEASPDLAYDIATKTDYPSYGYMIANGATTLWELWQKREGPSMNSHNHPMFGTIGKYFYAKLAGIETGEGGEGYSKVLIRPQVVRDLHWAEGSFDTMRGKVSSSWKREDGLLALDVIIPFGSDAEVRIPKLQMRDTTLSEGGTLLWKGGAAQGKAEGVTEVKETPGFYTVLCGGGHYRFELRGE
jgi:alpha-L-rhamnosidase